MMISTSVKLPSFEKAMEKESIGCLKYSNEEIPSTMSKTIIG